LALGGRLDEAFQEADRMLAEVRALGGYEMVSWILSTYPWLTDAAGIDRDTTGLATEAVKLTEEAGNRTWHVFAMAALALAEIHAGRWRQAITILTGALEDGRARGIRCEDAKLWALLARARILGGHTGEATQAADEAVGVALRQGAQVPACLSLLTRARILRLSGPEPNERQIEADIDAALVLVEETGATVYEPPLREERARLRGDDAELKQLVDLYTAIGATGHADRLRSGAQGSQWIQSV
jgi:hypothetical protein